MHLRVRREAGRRRLDGRGGGRVGSGRLWLMRVDEYNGKRVLALGADSAMLSIVNSTIYVSNRKSLRDSRIGDRDRFVSGSLNGRAVHCIVSLHSLRSGRLIDGKTMLIKSEKGFVGSSLGTPALYTQGLSAAE